ncbi:MULTISPECIES: type II TA system antitoxin MqsA family protein [Flavobacteriaceae]|uniref:DUF4065 domain-containing protein n=1 Tax=Galbibacter pacificus TaxID=2996052 RepID=A0ABT6FTG7_9FLAO|nr:type II TA system antitoxin MqsA family protein [Galbibacter pacificus]MDG3582480.1 DUF4065 domain-containing protein [Galbibacter pacificus]MDG3586402.1 DUF4065 domain-containing protein [Galbibacter pacificus]
MKSPITGKEMSIEVRNMELTFRKESFPVSYPSFYCQDSNQYFTSTEFDTIKMKQVYNQYRDKYNLPFPEEIKEIRSKYKLSASKMAEILGFGINSYRNYENGEVPNQSNANLIQLANDPVKFRSLVEMSNTYESGSKEQKELLNRIDHLIQKKRNKRFALIFEDYLLGDKLPDNHTGYLRPSIKKLTEMVVFFAETMNPFVTQLNKLLFYADFLHYKQEAVSMSGTRYRAINMGPVPNNYNSIYDFMNTKNAIDIIEREYDWGYSKEFKAKKDFEENLFSDLELEILNKVKNRFEKMSTTEIVNFSHLEDAWIENYENGKSLIDYKYAFNLKI